MFAMFGGELYSKRSARMLLSVRNRMRPPLGHCARLQTSLRKLDLERMGRRLRLPSFSLNHGRPLISIAPSIGEIQWSLAEAAEASAESGVAISLVVWAKVAATRNGTRNN